MTGRRKLLIAAAITWTITAACTQILGLEPPPSSDATTPMGDASLPETSPLPCMPFNADDASYRSMQNGGLDDAGEPTDGAAAEYVWSYFDLDTLVTGVGNYQGGVFDNNGFVYFVPAGSGATVMQYNTKEAFGMKTSWASFNTFTSLGAGKQGFIGAVFDGRYVYFVPYRTYASDGGAAYDGVVVRYDSTLPFTASTSWSSFDVGALPSDSGAPAGFVGGVYDGANIYLVPFFNGNNYDGRVARYAILDGGFDAATVDAGDAAPPPAQFAPASAWSTFDLEQQNGTAAGYYGGTFDGRYVYLTPYFNANTNTQYGSTVARYDTHVAFNLGSSWSYEEIGNFLNGAEGFVGAAFDGRYVYFAPHRNGIVARYDTTQGFNVGAAWSSFDLNPIASAVDGGVPSFAGTAFDGRFVYFIPATPLNTIVRYDTENSFNALCAWSTFDTSTVNHTLNGYFGAIYDGRYLYLVPRGSIVMRFDTKVNAAMPNLPGFHGSFF